MIRSIRALFYCILFCQATCQVAWCRVDIKTTKPLVIPVDNVTPKITKKDVEKLIPLDMEDGSSQGTVFSRIADRGFNLWFNSDAMKSSTLGRVAEKTQEKLKTDIVVPASTEAGVSHKFSVKVEAFQALAKLEYSGWLKGSINYDAKDSATNIEFREKVLQNKDLTFTHKSDSVQALSMVGLAWSW